MNDWSASPCTLSSQQRGRRLGKGAKQGQAYDVATALFLFLLPLWEFSASGLSLSSELPPESEGVPPVVAAALARSLEFMVEERCILAPRVRQVDVQNCVVARNQAMNRKTVGRVNAMRKRLPTSPPRTSSRLHFPAFPLSTEWHFGIAKI